MIFCDFIVAASGLDVNGLLGIVCFVENQVTAFLFKTTVEDVVYLKSDVSSTSRMLISLESILTAMRLVFGFMPITVPCVFKFIQTSCLKFCS
jgi:hypothetical protein